MLPIILLTLWITPFIVSVTALVTGNYVISVISLMLWLMGSYLLFKDTLNKVQVAARLYWITRDLVVTGTPFVSKGFMRETDAPWRTGQGIQLRVLSRTFQVGICSKGRSTSPIEDEVSGLVYAIQGRLMDDSPHKIGNWE